MESAAASGLIMAFPNSREVEGSTYIILVPQFVGWKTNQVVKN